MELSGADLMIRDRLNTIHVMAPQRIQDRPKRAAGVSSEVMSVGFLLIPGFSLMSYAAAIEPLRAANQLAGRALYRWWHATPSGKPAIASNGAAVLPDFRCGADVGRLNLLLVCAGGNPTTFDDRRTFAWIRKLAQRGVSIGGISGGPFILARAGLLHGRRCTIHWEHAPALQEAFPDIEITKSLFELDGERITCSGGVAALDMMIALIGREHGYSLAAAVSDWFLHTQVRNGVVPQRMDLRYRLGVADEKLIRVFKAMESHLETPLRRERLAEVAGVSLRHLERAFQAQFRRGIHEQYLALRLTRSRQLLRETSLSILEVAMAGGFGSASQFARAYRKVYGCSPRETRQREWRVVPEGAHREQSRRHQ